MADVVLADVRKVYPGGVEAVRGISFKVADGQFCVLVGPSGCGKSTLLRMVAGLETISSGTCVIDGRIVNAIEPADRDIAMVFQNYALYPHMSVYENMAYGLKNRGMSKPDIATRVAEAARILDIEALLERRPKALSGGQRQRVAMGRAIVRQPKVFLFDEPLSNLDAKLRIQMRVEIKKLQRRLGVTSLYVTHDQLEAMTLADILVVMNKGEVQQIGAPLDLYEKPATTFVATFIGAPPMNLITVGPELLQAGISGGAGIAVPAAGAFLGVRPEHLEMGAAPDGSLHFDVTVSAVEAVGAESYVYAAIGGTEAGGGEELIVRVAGKCLYPPGEKLKVWTPREHVHVFSKDTGKRID
jgi:sn-glycerol 3-phosphate transport system ATP-binding protein